jgi:predicted nucleotidyltransferase
VADLPASPRAPVKRQQNMRTILAEIIRKRPLKVIVFGSWARGHADEYSDLDVVVIQETDKRFLDRLEDMAITTPGMGVDLLVYTPREVEEMQARGNSFIESVLAEGVTVYARPN